jgi:hypothetical protein
MAAKTKTKKPTRRKPRTTAKKPAVARKPKAAKPRRKAAAKPARPKRAAPKSKPPKPAAAKSKPPKPAAIVEAPPLFVPEEQVAELEDSSGPAKKPGPLARLKSGVGNLFAKMTGRGKRRAPSESDGVPDDVTMDIHTGDILAAEPAPTKQRRRKPPPPPAGD